MSTHRHVFTQAIRYRGGGPMLAWFFHRVSGLAMILFVGLHILAGFSMQQFGSDVGTTINTIYESAYFQSVFYFLVIFHTINGLRVIMLDIFPKFLPFQRELTWLQWFVILPIYGLAVYVYIINFLSGS